MGLFDDISPDEALKFVDKPKTRSGLFDGVAPEEALKFVEQKPSFASSAKKGMLATGVQGEAVGNLLDRGLTWVGEQFIREPESPPLPAWARNKQQPVQRINHNTANDTSLIKTLEQYNAIKSDPAVQIAGEKAAAAYANGGLLSGLTAGLGHLIQNPGGTLRYGTEQGVAAAPGLMVGGPFGGFIKKVATNRIKNEVVRKVAGNAIQGGVINAAANASGGMPSYLSEGLEKNQGNLESAARYATKKGAVESAVNGVFGAIGSPLPARSLTGKLTNAATETLSQAAGGATGAYAAAKSVGEDISDAELWAEALGEATSVPGDMATAAAASRQTAGEPVSPDQSVDAAQRLQQIMQRMAPQAKPQPPSPVVEPATESTVDPLVAAMREAASEIYSEEATPVQQDVTASRTEALREQLAGSALGDIAPALIDSGQIVLHDTAETLPVRPEGAVPQGLTTEDGKIHLVADQLTPETVNAVTLHEAFHGGGKSLIGDAAWNKLMGNLSTLHQRAQRVGGQGGKFWRDAMRSVERANLNATLTPEEFGAYAIEHYEQAPAGVKRWVENTIGGVQAWAQQRFGAQVGTVTPGQLRALAVKALQQQAPATTGRFSLQQTKPKLIEAETKLQKADRLHFDKMNRVHHVENQTKEMGVELPDWLSAYDAEIAYHGRRGERLSDFRKNEYQSLANSMAENQITPERLDWYALARHAEERNAHIATVNPEMQDGGSGMTTQQAKDLLSGKDVTMQVELADKNGRVYRESVTVEGFSPEEIQRMEPAIKQLDQMTSKSRQLMKEYGLESSDAVDAWSEQYKHYVPLAGKAGLDEYGGSPGKQSGFSVRGGQKRATGRKSVAPNITEQVVRQVEDTINRGESNRVASNVVLFARQLQKQGMPEAPNGKPLFEVNPTDLRQYFRDGKLVKADMPATMGDDIVTARIDGKDVPVRINDPVYAEAIRNLNAQQFEGAMKWLNKLTRSISLLYTGANPQFLSKAYIRDLASVGALGQRYGNEIIAGAMKRQHTALKEAFQYEFTGKESEAFKQFRLLGGRTGFFHAERNLEQKRADLEKAIKAAGPINRHTAPEKLKRITSNTWEYYLASGSALESAVRYSVFRSALDNGRTPQEAAKIAKEITINFNRKGASNFARNANAMYAFYNASLQGARTTAIALKNKNVRRALYLYFGARTLGLITVLASLDDDEREKLLNNPEFRNAAIENLLIPTGDPERPYMPLPFGPDLAFTGGASLGVVDMLYSPDRNGAWHAAEAMAQSLTRAFSPPPVSDITRAAVNANSDNQGKAVMVAVLPTAIKPAAQASTGIDYLGRDIVPGSEFAKADPDAYKARKRNKTSWLTDFAIGLNELTGGNVARSGMIDVSPETFETLFRGYGGGIYSMIRDGVEVSTNPKKDWMDAPVIRQFIANPDALERGEAAVAREKMERFSEMRSEIKKLRQNGLHAQADELSEKMNSNGEFARLSANAEKILAKLNKSENKLGFRTDAEAMRLRSEIGARRKDVYEKLNQASKRSDQ